MEQRYKALRVIAMIYKLLGLIAAGITALAILALCAGSTLAGGLGQDAGLGGLFGGALGGLIGSIIMFIYGGGIALTLYAAGEAVFLLLALEENTRLSATLLQRQVSALSIAQPAYAGSTSPTPITHSPPASAAPFTGAPSQVQPHE